MNFPFFAINSSTSSSSGGSEYAKVNTYADLPSASANADVIYVVRNTTGTWILGTQKVKGMYRSNGTSWDYLANDAELTSIKVGSTTVVGSPVELVAGTNITITGDATAKTITVNAGGGSGAVSSVNTKIGDVVLNTADIADSTDKRYCTDAQKTIISNISGTNTGDETKSSIISELGTSLIGKNLLINAGFFVNQREYASGTTTAGTNQFTLDRWFIPTAGESLTFSDGSGVRIVTAPISGITQVIEGTSVQSGIYTLSWTGTATGYVNGTQISNGDNVNIVGGSNISIKFKDGTVLNPQFELGNIPTSFENRFISLENLLCQRYCKRIIPLSGSTYAIFGLGFNYSTTNCMQTINLAVPMRTAPSLSYSKLSDFQIWSNTVVIPTAMSSLNPSSSVITLDLTATLTAGNMSVLRGNNTASAWVQLTSELTS